MKLPKLPPNPADEWIKEIEKVFASLYRGEEYSSWIDAYRDFDVSLGQIIDDVVETKNDQIIIPVLKRTSTLLAELMDQVDNPDAQDKDSWLIEEIIEKWEIIVSDNLDKWEQERKDAFIAELKQRQELDVKNWDPSETQLQIFIDNTKYDYKRRLSEKTLKEVMDFLNRQIFDEDFDISRSHKFGGCRIEENEKAKQIFNRIKINLTNIPQPLPDDILFVLVLTIIGILQGKKRISKEVLMYARVSRQYLLKKYYDEYNKKKKHGYLFMLQACMRYLTRPLSSKQRTLLRERLGVDSHWSIKFRWDYFTAYQKMEGVQQPNWFNDFGEAPWYSSPEKLNEEMTNVVEELTYCIKKGYIQFNFVYWVSLKKVVRMKLEEMLNEEFQKTGKKSQKKENLALGTFLKEKYDAYMKQLIEYHKTSLKKEDLVSVLKDLEAQSDDPYQKIENLLEWRQKEKEYFMIKDEGQKLEYKSNFYRTKENLAETWKEEEEKALKKVPEDLKEEEEKRKEWIQNKIGKQSEFTDRKQKERVIEIFSEICAFLNTDGGKLLIGVPDNIKKPIFGIEKDHEQIMFVNLSDSEFRDKFLLHVNDKIKSEFSKEHHDYIKTELIILPKNKKAILMIDVETTPTRLAQIKLLDGKLIFVIREGSKSIRQHDNVRFTTWRDKKMKSSE
tara:strand:+ start:313 stop:2328 length:2016 start_codon:yes stop_codon:yes gene_type:complete